MELPVIKLTVDDFEDGVFATALVEDPAIQRTWLAFNNEKTYQFKEFDNEKRILVGALLVPDFKMFRNMKGKQFFVMFEKDEIPKVLDKMVLSGKLQSFNINHETNNPIPDTHIQQMFIIDSAMGMNTPKGLEEHPDGTLMAFVKVNNDDVWNDFVKTGKLKGFSVEGQFSTSMDLCFQLQEIEKALEKETNQKLKMNILEELKKLTAKLSGNTMTPEEIINAPIKMGATTTAGVELEYEGELAEGTMVTLEDGTTATGEHTLEDGTVIVLDEAGKVTSIATPEPVDEMSMLKDQFEKISLEKENLKKQIENFQESITKTNEQFSAQTKEIESLKETSKEIVELISNMIEEKAAPKTHEFKAHNSTIPDSVKEFAEKIKRQQESKKKN